MTTTALQVYNKQDILEYASRLFEAMPGSKKLELWQAQAVAEIALLHNLDPYNGEVWFISGVGVSVGIKGYRKHSRRQLKEEGEKGSTFWTHYERATDPTVWGADKEDMVYLCHLRDDVSLKAWADTIKYFKEVGLQDKVAIEAAGKAPVYVGVGILKKGESSGKMPRVQRCQKRSEAHALKQRFDIQFAFGDDDLMNPNVVETEWLEEEPVRVSDKIGKSADVASEELGFIRDPEKIWTKRQVEVVLENSPHIQGETRAISFLDKSELGDMMEAYSQVMLKTIRAFSECFQSQIEDGKKENVAFVYTKENWNK